jgi:hypothetical protein
MTVAPASQLPNLHSAADQLSEQAPDRRCSVVQIEVSSAQPSQLAPAQVVKAASKLRERYLGLVASGRRVVGARNR